MKQLTTITAGLLFAVVAMMLAGCGSHDQNSPGAGGSQGTPPEITQQSQKNLQNAPPATYTPPGEHK